MLVRGELDGYVIIDSYGGLDSIVPVAKIGSSDYYFAVNKNRPDLLEELERTLSRIQDENRYYNQTLFEKYIRSTGANLFLDDDELDWLAEYPVIRVGYQDDYLAYCDKDEDTGELTGALKDYLEAASDCMANAHLQFEAVSYPSSSSSMEALEKGEVDCIFPIDLSFYEAEKRSVSITSAVMNAEVYAVVRSAEQTSFSEWEHAEVAVVEGDLNDEEVLKDHFSDWVPVYYPDSLSCLRAVAEDKADCMLISSYRANNQLAQHSKYHLTTIDTGVSIGYCFAVSGASPALYSILSRVANLVPSATVSASLTRYFSKDSKTTLIGFARDNPLIAAAFVLVIVALVGANIAQRRMIQAERRAADSERQVEHLGKRVFVI